MGVTMVKTLVLRALGQQYEHEQKNKNGPPIIANEIRQSHDDTCRKWQVDAKAMKSVWEQSADNNKYSNNHIRERNDCTQHYNHSFECQFHGPLRIKQNDYVLFFGSCKSNWYIPKI